MPMAVSNRVDFGEMYVSCDDRSLLIYIGEFIRITPGKPITQSNSSKEFPVFGKIAIKALQGDKGDDFLPKKKVLEWIMDFLEIKKRSLACLSVVLQKVTKSQAKRMKKICESVQRRKGQSPSDETLPKSGLSNDEKDSQRKLDMSQSDSGVSNSCLRCSLHVNIFETLERIQECCDIGLDICKRIEKVLNNTYNVISPRFAFTTLSRNVSITELRCLLRLSFQVLKLKTYHGRHLSKIYEWLLFLCANDKNVKDTTTATVVSGLQSCEREEEIPIEQTDKETTDQTVCQLAKNTVTGLEITHVRQLLEILIEYSKFTNHLEKSVIELMECLLEKEEAGSLPQSLDRVAHTLECFTKDNLVLQHYWNIFEKQPVLVSSRDQLKQVFCKETRTVPNGEGRLSSLDRRSLYEGEWFEGRKHGYGKGFIMCKPHSFWSNVGEYTGNWKDNARHGFGHMVFSDGSIYDGDWRMDQMQGYGVMNRFDGCIFEGYWSNGNINGCITFTWPDGRTEYREYKEGSILRVYKPRHISIVPPLDRVENVERARKEKAYYKTCLTTLRNRMDAFRINCQKGKLEKEGQIKLKKFEILKIAKRR